MRHGNRRPSVTFKLSDSRHHFRSINSNLSIASQSYFNYRYKDYLMRVREVNKAKEMLKNNRDQMSTEVKRRMIQHIKHKMKIISMIEDELKMDTSLRN